MTKVSYCLSGESRSLEIWDSHAKHIISPLTADVFLHTWKQDVSGTSSFPFKQRSNWAPFVYSNIETIETINPLSYLIENPMYLEADIFKHIERSSEWSDLVPRDRCFKMWRSWYLSYKCMELYGTYDIVIKSRSDLLFHSPLLLCLKDMNNNAVYIPEGNDGQNLPPGISVCDWFAIGTPESMKKYCSIYKCVGEYMKNGIPLHPEIMLKHHLDVCGVEVVRFPYQYSLFRK